MNGIRPSSKRRVIASYSASWPSASVAEKNNDVEGLHVIDDADGLHVLENESWRVLNALDDVRNGITYLDM